jgi:Domain of unknown function (DUF1707)
VEPPPPEMRIGDRERREVDARLQQALADGMLTLAEYDERSELCWAARTRSDLNALTLDLPEPPPSEPTVALETAAPAAPAAPDAGMLGRAIGGLVTAAVIGGGIFVGIQVLSADDGASVFGSKTVNVGSGQQRVEVGMMFGSLRVIVPDDVSVRPSGTVVFGSTNCNEACRTGPGLREVAVEADGAFGSVSIMRQSEFDRAAVTDRNRDRDRDWNDDSDDSDDDD